MSSHSVRVLKLTMGEWSALSQCDWWRQVVEQDAVVAKSRGLDRLVMVKDMVMLSHVVAVENTANEGVWGSQLELDVIKLLAQI